jgi:CheY-like chemotaxis protein
MTKHVAKVLVDDDEELRVALSDLLEDQGYTVQVAEDGAAGLALLRSGYRPCVILLDLVMAGMDGWD